MAAVAQTAEPLPDQVNRLWFCRRFTPFATFETALLGSSNNSFSLLHDLSHSGWSAPAVVVVEAAGVPVDLSAVLYVN
jgi:hypothetical protein